MGADGASAVDAEMRMKMCLPSCGGEGFVDIYPGVSAVGRRMQGRDIQEIVNSSLCWTGRSVCIFKV